MKKWFVYICYVVLLCTITGISLWYTESGKVSSLISLLAAGIFYTGVFIGRESEKT